MPGSEVIGFKDSNDHVTIHSRNCPDAIRTASEKGNTIVAVDNFEADDTLYPVAIEVIGIDRYHLLQDVLDCIVKEHKISMSGLTSRTRDNIVTCRIDFLVQSAQEFRQALESIQAIDGIDEVNTVLMSR